MVWVLIKSWYSGIILNSVNPTWVIVEIAFHKQNKIFHHFLKEKSIVDNEKVQLTASKKINVEKQPKK
jgi:hypothetical protein